MICEAIRPRVEHKSFFGRVKQKVEIHRAYEEERKQIHLVEHQRTLQARRSLEAAGTPISISNILAEKKRLSQSSEKNARLARIENAKPYIVPNDDSEQDVRYSRALPPAINKPKVDTEPITQMKGPSVTPAAFAAEQKKFFDDRVIVASPIDRLGDKDATQTIKTSKRGLFGGLVLLAGLGIASVAVAEHGWNGQPTVDGKNVAAAQNPTKVDTTNVNGYGTFLEVNGTRVAKVADASAAEKKATVLAMAMGYNKGNTQIEMTNSSLHANPVPKNGTQNWDHRFGVHTVTNNFTSAEKSLVGLAEGYEADKLFNAPENASFMKKMFGSIPKFHPFNGKDVKAFNFLRRKNPAAVKRDIQFIEQSIRELNPGKVNGHKIIDGDKVLIGPTITYATTYTTTPTLPRTS